MVQDKRQPNIQYKTMKVHIFVNIGEKKNEKLNGGLVGRKNTKGTCQGKENKASVFQLKPHILSSHKRGLASKR